MAQEALSSVHPLLPSEQLKDKSLFIEEAYINGKWDKKAKTFDVFDTGGTPNQLGGVVAHREVKDFHDAIEAADIAQQEFAENTTAAQRGAILRKWNDLILANLDDLGTILSLENGKTFGEAKGEVQYAASFISWFAEEATRSYGYTIPSSTPHTSVYTTKEPVGVCGIITPWNFPAAMITRKVAPAIAAGCSVVIKPPSETPYSALALAKLGELAGIPAGLVNVLPTRDRQAATELATHPTVRKISFTGSTGVGKMLAKLAAGTLKKVSLELGGNAPFIVFDDADLDLAIAGVMICKFRCSGQTCVLFRKVNITYRVHSHPSHGVNAENRGILSIEHALSKRARYVDAAFETTNTTTTHQSRSVTRALKPGVNCNESRL